MKNLIALPIIAGLATVLAGPLSAADMENGAKMAATNTSMQTTMAKPHFQHSGMRASAELGEKVFIEQCALCHGLFGKGDGPRSAFFQPGVQYIPDMTNRDLMAGRDDQLLQSIREGVSRLPKPAYVMPQFKYILSEEEIKSTLMYIHTLFK